MHVAVPACSRATAREAEASTCHWYNATVETQPLHRVLKKSLQNLTDCRMRQRRLIVGNIALHRASSGTSEFQTSVAETPDANARRRFRTTTLLSPRGPRLHAAESTGSRDTLCACGRQSQVPRKRSAHRAGVTCSLAGSSHVLRPAPASVPGLRRPMEVICCACFSA
jgi:hypothetical protein